MLASCPAAHSATFYAAPIGNSSVNGSNIGAPTTIANGVLQLANGDTLLLRGGTYSLSQRVVITVSGGTGTNVRTVKAYTGETPVINCSGNTDSNVLNRRAFDIQSASGWTIAGLEIKNAAVAIASYNASNVTVRNCHIHDCTNGGIGFDHDETSPNSTGNLIENNIVHDVVTVNSPYTATSWGAAISMKKHSNSTIRNNTVYRVYAEGMLAFLSDHITMQNNTVYDTYSACYYLDNTTDSVIEKNLGYQTHSPLFYPTNPPNGIRISTGLQVANEAYGTTNPVNRNRLSNNVLIGCRYGFTALNYQNGGGFPNHLVAHNTFYNTEAGVFRIQDNALTTGSEIKNNLIVGGVASASDSALGGINWSNNGWFGVPRPSAMVGSGDVMNSSAIAVAFVNAGTYVATGYRLTTNSPAKNAGADLRTRIADDYAGTTRDANPDIGAFEFVGTVSLPSAAALSASPPARK